MAHQTKYGAKLKRRHTRVVLSCVAVVVVMTGLAYASVPLYALFCQVTGYGGTTRVATKPPATILERQITVRFDANADRELGWSFEPAQNKVTLKVGQQGLAFYRAWNRTDRAKTGSATFNVTPQSAGAYFNKIACFCFTEQVLEPGQKADLPVAFFIDPAIVDDPDLKSVDTITLSYTFFEVQRAAKLQRPPSLPGSRAVRSGGD